MHALILASDDTVVEGIFEKQKLEGRDESKMPKLFDFRLAHLPLMYMGLFLALLESLDIPTSRAHSLQYIPRKLPRVPSYARFEISNMREGEGENPVWTIDEIVDFPCCWCFGD